MDEEFLQATFDARSEYLRQLGVVNDDLLAPLINPHFMGGPRWPAMRQSWRTIRNGSRTIIVSDGLSDSFDEEQEPGVGLGIEVLGETTDVVPVSPQQSWLFEVVYEVSQQAAHHGGFRELIDDLGVVSMEIKAPSGLASLATEEGRVGLLLGIPLPGMPHEWSLPGGFLKVVTVKVLHPSELAYAVEQGDAGRELLKQRFEADGTHHVSSLTRPPVV